MSPRRARSIGGLAATFAIAIAFGFVEGCTSAVDEFAPCGATEKLCDGTCVSRSLPAHGCGSDDCSPCSLDSAVATCAGGECAVNQCASGRGDCDDIAADGCETNLLTASDHCGSCNTPCTLQNAVPKCEAGTCAIVSCEGGFGDCDGSNANGCEADFTDATSCGSCDLDCTNAPGAGPDGVCARGACLLVCDPDRADCSAEPGCETFLDIDSANCGSCGFDCGGGKCASGTCQPVAVVVDVQVTAATVDEMFVYFAHRNDDGDAGVGTSIHRIEKSTINAALSDTTVVADEVPDEFLISNAYGIAANATDLYFSMWGAFASGLVQPKAPESGIYRVPKLAERTLPERAIDASLTFYPTGISLRDDGSIYWSNRGLDFTNGLYLAQPFLETLEITGIWRRDAEAETKLLVDTECYPDACPSGACTVECVGNPGGIVTTDDGLYWARHEIDATAGIIHNTLEGAPVAQIAGYPLTAAVAADETHVYWSTALGGASECSITRAAHELPAEEPATIHSGVGDIVAVDVDDAFLYFGQGDTLWKLRKPAAR